jgi:hypothetical protein
MKKFFRPLLFLIVCNSLFVLANIPFWQRNLNVPKGDFHPFVFANSIDYYEYVSFIREGKDGNWSVLPMYSTEPGPKTVIYLYYIFLGKIAAVSSLSPFLMFHVARFINLQLYALSLYFVCRLFIGKSLALPAALVSLFASTPMAFLNWQNPVTLKHQIPAGWENYNAIVRVDGVPHHQFAAALLFLIVAIVFTYFKNRQTIYLILAAVGAFILAIIYPPPALVIAAVFPLTYFWINLKKSMRTGKITWENLIPVMVLILTVGLGLLIIRLETLKGFPWDQAVVWEIELDRVKTDFNLYFWLSGGILMLTAIPMAIRYLISEKDQKRIFTAFWMIFPYLFITFIDFLPIAKNRVYYLVGYVPAAILSVEFIADIAVRVSRKWIRFAVIMTAVGIFSANAIPTTVILLSQYSPVYGRPDPGITSDIKVMLDFLAKKIPPGSHILANEDIGLVIPAFAPQVVYVGHEIRTLDYYKKQDLTASFYLDTLDRESALKLIRDNGIKYIVVGPRESAFGAVESYQLPVDVVYQNATVTVYRVI